MGLLKFGLDSYDPLFDSYFLIAALKRWTTSSGILLENI